jgi:cbb3-type cytochrome oxidase maturation protein
MEILFLLVCVSVSVATIFLAMFIWSVKSGQYEDCHTPAMRMLFDEKVNVKDDELKKGEKEL